MGSQIAHEPFAFDGNVLPGNVALQHRIAQGGTFGRQSHQGASDGVAHHGDAPQVKANDVGTEPHDPPFERSALRY